MSRVVSIGLSTVLATTDRWADARYTELREWTGLSDATVTRALKDLSDLGLIEAHVIRSKTGRIHVTYKPTALGKVATRYIYYSFAGVKGFDILQFVLKRLTDEACAIYAKHQIKSVGELWRKLERGEISEAECKEDLERLDYLEGRIESVRKRLRR